MHKRISTKVLIDKPLICSILVLGVICTCFLSVHFQHIDFGIYLLYTKSLVNDFDFNLINQLISSNNHYLNRFVITPEVFDANYHPFGSAIFYAPFYYLGAIGESFWGSNLTERTMGLGTVFYSLITFSILYKAFTINVCQRKVIWALLITFFATPWFFYTAIEPGNANVLAMFLSSLFFTHLQKDNKNYFYLGCVISIMFLSKIETVFYVIPIIGVLIQKPLIKTKLLIPITGILALMLFVWGRSLRYGELFLGYGGIETAYFVLDDILFAPVHGYLFASPIYVLVVFLVLINWNVLQDRYLFYFLGILILKIFLEAFTINSGVNMGARSHLIDIPLFACAMVKVLSLKSRFTKHTMVACTVWTFINICIYQAGFRLQGIKSFFEDYMVKSDTYSSMLELIKIDIFVFLVSIIMFGIGIKIVSSFRLKKYLIYILSLGYVMAVFNTSIKDFYEVNKDDRRVIIGKAPKIWFLREETSNFVERLDFLLYRNDLNEYKYVLSDFRKYLDRAESEIVRGDIQPYWSLYNSYNDFLLKNK